MPEALQFTIATDKPRYRVDEPIRLRARLTNGGREPVVVNGRLGLNPSGRTGEVRLEVDGPAQPSEIIVSVNMGSPAPDSPHHPGARRVDRERVRPADLPRALGAGRVHATRHLPQHLGGRGGRADGLDRPPRSAAHHRHHRGRQTDD
jgi:hypothetical protein